MSVRSVREAKAVSKKVGKLLKERRVKCNLSREDVGKAIGVAQQQIAKYEWGRNRISVPRLVAIAKFLGSPPSSFID